MAFVWRVPSVPPVPSVLSAASLFRWPKLWPGLDASRMLAMTQTRTAFVARIVIATATMLRFARSRSDTQSHIFTHISRSRRCPHRYPFCRPTVARMLRCLSLFSLAGGRRGTRRQLEPRSAHSTPHPIRRA